MNHSDNEEVGNGEDSECEKEDGSCEDNVVKINSMVKWEWVNGKTWWRLIHFKITKKETQ